MLMSLLLRPKWPANPTRTYYAVNGFSSLFYVLTFTLSLVYYVTEVGLSPLQMVLVGTVLEAVCFFFEIPTGIVADLYSRRLSIIIGLGFVGLGFVLQAAMPTFGAVIAAQVLWGIGFTFTSGALEAWITDEVGEEHVAHVFTREQQLHLTATVVGTVAAGALGLVDLRLPMIVSGVGFLVLAGVMLAVMPEEHFSPTPRAKRETFKHMTSSFTHGIKIARSRPVVRSFFLISLIVGLSSEAFDRLWTVRILQDFPLPLLFGTRDPAVWFTLFALIGTGLSLATSLVVNKISAQRVNALHPNGLLALLAGAQVVGIVGLALFGNMWLALAAMWFRDAAAAVAQPIQAAWLNRNVDSQVRATVLSMNAQANAIGQVAGGPPLGVLANRTSLSAALVTSAVILSPIVLIYTRLRPTPRINTAHDANPGPVSTSEPSSAPAPIQPA